MLYRTGKIGGFCHLYSGRRPWPSARSAALRRGRLRHHRLPRPRPRPGPRHGPRAGMAELLGKADRLLQGQGRLDALLRRRERLPRRPRDRRQPHPAGRRRRLRHQVPRAATRSSHLLLRRRRDNQGAFHEAFNMAASGSCRSSTSSRTTAMSMGTPLQRALAATDDLTVRGGTAYGIRGDLIDGNDIEAMATSHRRGRQARPRRRGADVHRGPDLPLPRPLDERPDASTATKEEVEEAKRARPDRAVTSAAEGARLDRRGGAGRRCTRRSRPRSTRRSSSPRTPRADARGAVQDVTVARLHPPGVIGPWPSCHLSRGPATRR